MSTRQVSSSGARELFAGRLVPRETIADLADRTPFYIYDLATVQRCYRELTAAVPPQVRVYYAIKANPSLRLVQELTALGAGMEIASSGELAVAERLGISGDRVLFTGPAKTDDELAASVRYGLRTINVESLREAERLDAISARLGRRQPILLRINAGFEIHDADAAVQLGGGAQKFGVDEEQLDTVLPQLLRLRHLDLRGMHVFAATGVLEASLLVEYTSRVFDLVAQLERDHQRRFPVVDLGGGLGVDYRAFPGRDLDLAHYASSLRDLVTAFGFGDKEIVLELGRYLVGEAGTYVVRVLDVKHSRGTDYAIVDGGTNHFRRPVAVRQDHPVTLVLPAAEAEDRQGALRPYAVGGPLCTSIDVIARAALLPPLREGDLLAFHKAGAYGLTMSSLAFLSHAWPAEYLLESDGTTTLIREPLDPKTFLDSQYYRENSTSG
ncbi:MAG: diaminopimelate decarboxylase [Dehalococcoidia bacterium]|nr:diaminopimelate decarboxylase [Dehalococcoidia bacterium]